MNDLNIIKISDEVLILLDGMKCLDEDYSIVISRLINKAKFL